MSGELVPDVDLWPAVTIAATLAAVLWMGAAVLMASPRLRHRLRRIGADS
ncbi:hypothetical protein [Homoserinibacter sp. YIM 151385]|nr:hypothetical protein [Homoserinibacter sp. YIM 151385]WBU38529.1 hypothetical protein OF852_02785 [Homoserinibacter sp. YIM 151385]